MGNFAQSGNKELIDMKKNILLLLCLVGLLSCTDRKDLYNPDLKTDPKDNPLEVEVPNNVDYSMITAVTVRVDVDDEYLGKYYYVVEVYDNDPLFSETPNLKAAGVAKQGEPFVKNIDIATAQKYLFIKRTDPRGRSVVGCLEVTEGATSLSYDFNPSTSKSVAPRVAARATVEVPTYTEVPAGAIEVKGAADNDLLENGKNYCITGDYSGGIYYYGGGACKLFVSGTWTIKPDGNWQGQIEKGLEVIILPGGKITSEAKLSFVGDSKLVLMSGSEMKCNELYLTNSGNSFVLGKLEIDSDLSFNSSATFYNQGEIFCGRTISYTNSCLFVNDGTVKAGNLKLDASAQLEDNCSMILKDNFTCKSASAQLKLNKGYLEARLFEFDNATISLENGSMIYATGEISNNYKNIYIASGTNTSLIRAPKIQCVSVDNEYKGNLVVEFNTHTEMDQWTHYFKYDPSVKMAQGFGQGGLTIAICTGEVVDPDPGHDPADPTFPLEVIISDVYTYAMEDQWPSYGDYDMNDVVVLVKKNIKTQVSAGNGIDYASELELDVDLLAVGADKQIGAGIQLDGISISRLKEVIHNKKETITGFSLVDENNNHSEQGSETDDIILPLFNSASTLLGGNYVNVGKGASTTSYPNMKINVSFENGKVSVNDLNYAKINFFIITDGVGQDRTEIHLPGYTATRKANKSLFGEGDDNGKGIYVSRENLSWGLLVPIATWRWPNEGVNIKTIYPFFESWITSGGKNDKDWYQQRRD